MKLLNVSTNVKQSNETEQVWRVTAEEQQKAVRAWGVEAGTASSAVLKETDLVWRS